MQVTMKTMTSALSKAAVMMSLALTSTACIDNAKRQIEMPDQPAPTVDNPWKPDAIPPGSNGNPNGTPTGDGKVDVVLNPTPGTPGGTTPSTTPTTPVGPTTPTGGTNVGITPVLPSGGTTPVTPPGGTVATWDGASDVLVGGWKVRDL